MSLFFVNERRPKVEPVELVVDLEAALEEVSKRAWPEKVAAVGGISVEQARKLASECRRIEPLLIAAIQSGEVTSSSGALTFVREAAGDLPFPAAKFLQRIAMNVGSEAVPATWAQVAAAAQTEAA